jgi:hypothetical protein
LPIALITLNTQIMMKKNLIFFFFFFALVICSLSAQNEPVKGVTDTTPRPKNEKNDKQLLEDIKRDIEKQNGKKSEIPSHIPSPIQYYEVIEKQPVVKVKKERTPLAAPPKHYKHEVSLETGVFFKQIFRLFGLVKDTQSFPVSPYLVAYKYRPKKGYAFRLGIGADYAKSKEQLGGFLDNKTIKSNSYDARLGFERTMQIDDRWVFMLGGDLLAGYAKSTKTFDSGFDRNIRTLTNKGWGFGLVAGIRYDFSWRVSLGSETSFIFSNKKIIEKDEFTSNPQFNKVVKEGKDDNARFYGPANIYLSVRF